MDLFIHDAVRSPRGKARPDGGLASMKPQELVTGLIDAMEQRGKSPRDTDALILGCVGQIGAQGANVALVTKMHAGLPDAAFAYSINNYCVSSLTAVGQAGALIAAGAAKSVLAGGVEMMSRVPFMADNADFYTDASFPARTRYIPVALAADRLAAETDTSRAEMDAVSLDSQRKTAAAEGTALNASRIALNGLDREEAARPKTTMESLAALEPAFADLAAQYADALAGRTFEHRMTLAHAPPVCDGAGLALVTARSEGARARIVAWAEAGGDPAASLTAGTAAMEKALARACLRLSDMDRVEFMEAFAVTLVNFLKRGDVDASRVNVSGGHIAKGHPMGATGAILVSTLLDTLDAANGRYGLVVASGAQGVGSALIVERV